MTAHPLVVLLLTTFLLALLCEVPSIPRSVGTPLLQAAFVGFFVCAFTGSVAQDRVRRLVIGPQLIWMALMLALAVFYVIKPPASSFGFGSLMRPFAGVELVRLGLCFGVYFVAANALRQRDLKPLLLGLQIFCVGVGVYGLFQFGNSGGGALRMTSIFGNHEQLGTLLMLFLPLSLALARAGESGQRVQLASQAGTVLLVCAVVFAQARSAWIGAFCGLITMGLLMVSTKGLKMTRRTVIQVVVPAAVLGLLFAVLAFSDEFGPMLSARFSSFSHGVEDASLSERIHRWKAACVMMSQQPLIGWGLGSFPVLQWRWTHTGDLPQWVVAHGTGHSNLAHNFYVQWGAETGVIGLTLYVAALVTILLDLLRSLRGTKPGLPRDIMIGCAGCLVSALADMVASPSYTYPGESVLLWLLLGLGSAACRFSRDDANQNRAKTTPLWTWLVSILVGAIVAFTVLAVGIRASSEHQRVGCLRHSGTAHIACNHSKPLCRTG